MRTDGVGYREEFMAFPREEIARDPTDDISARSNAPASPRPLNRGSALGDGMEAAREATVSLRGISHCYGRYPVLADVSLDILAGEFVTLLGQSGSGKTTLLRIVAGLMRPTAGSVTIAGRDVTHVPTQKRGVGFVFQNYALFPHLTVFENIAYPLRIRHVGRAEIAKRVQDTLARIHLPDVGQRLPSQLSGGQQQRIAVARALVYEPSVLLMDEPLSALDRKLRQHMQFELRQLHEELGLTCIFVTHDQEEALTMSDRVVIMETGSILQVGTPAEVYDRPASSFVADFIGSTNFLPCRALGTADDDILLRSNGGTELKVPRPAEVMPTGQQLLIAIRPEHVIIDREASPGGGIKAEIKNITYLGNCLNVVCLLTTGEEIIAQCSDDMRKYISVGQFVFLRWPTDAVNLFSGEAAGRAVDQRLLKKRSSS